jgi:protein-tyrosine phosphatase
VGRAGPWSDGASHAGVAGYRDERPSVAAVGSASVDCDPAIDAKQGGAATHATAGRPLGIASLPNLRDLGGHPTGTGGRVRTGLVYRSTALAGLDGPDADAFAALGVRTVYDLRTAIERTSAPDRLPPGAIHVVADVIDGKVEGSPGYMLQLLARPDDAERELGGERATALWIRHYRDFVRLDSARSAYASVFLGLADPARRPILFHCSTGKDRTGWLAAALLLFLGVDHAEVMDDYLASARHVEPMLRRFAQEYATRGGDPALIHVVFATLPVYLETALDEVRRTYGDIEGYVADGLGIDPDTRAAIRDALLDRG